MRTSLAPVFAVLSLLAIACSSSKSGSSGSTGTGGASSDAGSTGGSGGEAAMDAAAPDSSASMDAPSAPTCGPPPARFTILTGANAGLVQDNVTMLVWMSDSMGGGEPPQTQTDAATYCSGLGMRLPTEAEAQELAASYVPCAFGMWSTWTSTAVGTSDAWVVDYLGDTSPQVADNFPSAVLCVRDPGG
jgi:hypothetical protein